MRTARHQLCGRSLLVGKESGCRNLYSGACQVKCFYCAEIPRLRRTMAGARVCRRFQSGYKKPARSAARHGTKGSGHPISSYPDSGRLVKLGPQPKVGIGTKHGVWPSLPRRYGVCNKIRAQGVIRISLGCQSPSVHSQTTQIRRDMSFWIRQPMRTYHGSKLNNWPCPFEFGPCSSPAYRTPSYASTCREHALTFTKA